VASPNEKGRIGPRQALAALAKAMPKDAMVSTDIGNVCSVSIQLPAFRIRAVVSRRDELRQLRLCLPRGDGSESRPSDRPAIAYVGDGAWGKSLNEVMTCVRENIPVVAVVFNNGQWGAEKKNQVDYSRTAFSARI